MPRLQFNNISLGVAHVTERQAAGAGDVEGDDFTVTPPARRDDFGGLFCNIGNFESDVAKARPRNLRMQRFLARRKFENLQRRSVFAMTGQTQMPPSSVSSGARGESFEFRAV